MPTREPGTGPGVVAERGSSGRPPVPTRASRVYCATDPITPCSRSSPRTCCGRPRPDARATRPRASAGQQRALLRLPERAKVVNVTGTRLQCVDCGNRPRHGKASSCARCLRLVHGYQLCSVCTRLFVPPAEVRSVRCERCRRENRRSSGRGGSVWTVGQAGSPGLGGAEAGSRSCGAASSSTGRSTLRSPHCSPTPSRRVSWSIWSPSGFLS